MTEWKTIESAPREARVILWCSDLGWDHETHRKKVTGAVFGRVIHYDDGGMEARGEGMTGEWTFTHWLPLPNAPEGDG